MATGVSLPGLPGLQVNASVKFHRQELFKAEEIQDVIVDCDLAAELQPKASVSQPKPKCLFSVGSPTLPHLFP